jgi:hypothetical protein
VKRGAEAAGLDSKRLDGQSGWIRRVGEGMFACRCVSVPSNRLERRNLAESAFLPAVRSWGLRRRKRTTSCTPPECCILVDCYCRLLRLLRGRNINICIICLCTVVHSVFRFASLLPSSAKTSTAGLAAHNSHATSRSGSDSAAHTIISVVISYCQPSGRPEIYTVGSRRRLLTLLVVSAILLSFDRPCQTSSFIHKHISKCGLQYPPSL